MQNKLVEQTEPWKLNVEPYDEKEEVTHFDVTHEFSGLHLTKKDTSKEVSTIKIFAQIFGKMIAAGGFNIDDITLPSVMLWPESLIEVYLYGFNFLTVYIGEAAKIDDPLERIKLAMSGMIANMHVPNMRSNGNPPIPSRIGQTCSVLFH
jgi:hypothetical protein